MVFLFPSGYGKVFLVRKVSEGDRGQLFAMKVLKKATIVKKRKVMEHTLTERSVLEAIRDFPFLVTLHYAFQTETKLHLIMGEWLWGEGSWEGLGCGLCQFKLCLVFG